MPKEFFKEPVLNSREELQPSSEQAFIALNGRSLDLAERTRRSIEKNHGYRSVEPSERDSTRADK